MQSTQNSSYQYSQNLNDIIDILDTGVETVSSIRNVVTPLIERVKYSEQCYNAIQEMLLLSPQCQSLRDENEMLRKKCGYESPNIFVEVKERDINASNNNYNKENSDIKKVRTDLPCNYGGSFPNDKLHVFSNLIDKWSVSGVDIPASTIKTAFNHLFNNFIIKDNESQTEEVDKIIVETHHNQLITSRSMWSDITSYEEVNIELNCPTHSAVKEEEVVEEDEEEEEEETDNESSVPSTERKVPNEKLEEEVVEEEVVEEEVEDEEEEVEEEEDEEDEDEETDKESPVPSTERKVPNENLEEEEEDEDVFEIEMEDEDGNQLRYYTNNEENGDIYEILSDDEIGSNIGKFVDGEPEFFEE
jgi:hypothetical protein